MPSIFTTHFAFLDSEETIQFSFELGDLSKKPDDGIDEADINPEPPPTPQQETTESTPASESQGADETSDDQQEDSDSQPSSETSPSEDEEDEDEEDSDTCNEESKKNTEECRCKDKICYKDSKRKMKWEAVPGALQTHLKNLAESALHIASREFKRKTKNLNLPSFLRSYIGK